MKKFLIVLALIGVLDAGYLTIEHFSNFVPPCTTGFSLVDCGAVLRSSYAEVYGVPLAALGLLHYCALLTWLILTSLTKKRWPRYFAVLESLGGAVFSIYLIYLQLAIIHSICVYCMLSALVSLALCVLTVQVFALERKRLVVTTASLLYTYLAKPIFFLVDPEQVHVSIVRLGEFSAYIPGMRQVERWLIHTSPTSLAQNVDGLKFALPIGLAAGFDYEGRLTQSLAPLGFGFQTIGTITNTLWKGNAKPRLGRLPNSKSLMVNKGFRNPGANAIINKLRHSSFDIPVGISVGDAKGNISDIVEAFQKFERAPLAHSYYELNISCPNLHGAMSFYMPKNLERLLTSVDRLHLSRPVWIKMPINLSDSETLTLLAVIAKHSPTAVIFGNLQHNRKDPSIDQKEVQKFTVGNFSGKPTFSRSNELISLAYAKYKKRFVIVGCGGVFTADDAFEKIARGASLIQMITGMIFQGPQVVAQMNMDLHELLLRHGYTSISQAVGSNTNKKHVGRT